jgi:tellurite resistance protein TerC
MDDMIDAGPAEWAVFWAVVMIALGTDIVATRKESGAFTMPRAALWSALWIALALAFGVWVAVRFGREAGVTYLTAYLLEKSLSIDNVFVFVLIFSQTGIPAALQRRALFWGIFGALVMRAALIASGLYLLERFHWVIYPFAALLLYTALRILREEKRGDDLASATCTLCHTWISRVVPIAATAQGERFLVRSNGRLHATPFLVAIVAIEATDLAFAVDSIPAVLAVTREPYLVYTSNVLALIGLRSLYFLLAGLLRRLRFLRAGLAFMLVFVAGKLVVGDAIEISPFASLAVIAGTFTVSIIASWAFPALKRGRK